jgi:hypothetical protein
VGGGGGAEGRWTGKVEKLESSGGWWTAKVEKLNNNGGRWTGKVEKLRNCGERLTENVQKGGGGIGMCRKHLWLAASSGGVRKGWASRMQLRRQETASP